MRVVLILFFLWTAPAFAQWGLGVGYSATTASQVNPDAAGVEGGNELYLSYTVHPWSLLAEFAYHSSQSGVGDYAIGSESYSGLLWGRFEPWAGLSTMSPFLGLGVGWGTQRITTDFGSAHDSRWTDAGFEGGLSLGVMTTLLEHWDLEGDLRVIEGEFAAEPMFGFAVRTGWRF